MKVLLVMAGCLVVAGCAASPGAQAADEVVRPSVASGADCQVWRNFEGVDVCRQAGVIQAADAVEVPALAIERRQEVVGEERPHLVLDGAS